MATKNPPEDLLARVKADYKSFSDYIKPKHNKWADYWNLWNNERIRREYHGESDSFEPMTFQMVESIVDNVYGSRPKMSFLPTQKEQEQDTKILNALWDYNWGCNDMDQKIIPWGREITITGNGCLFLSWEDGKMKMVHKPIRDCILDTNATEPDAMRFAGYRRLEMLEDLKKAKWFDPEKGAWVPRYKNLDDVATWDASGDDKMDKELKDCYEGSTLDDKGKEGQVEVIYMAYRDKIIEVANREQVIFSVDNPFHRDAYEMDVQLKDNMGQELYDETTLPEGAELMNEDELANALAPEMTRVTVPEIEPFLPVVMQREFVDPALLIAKGDVEPFASTQEDLNDTLNIHKDNLIFQQQNIGLVDFAAKESISEIARAKPGDMVPVMGGPQAIGWVEKPDMSNAGQAELQRAKQSIRDTARVDEVVQGVSDNQDKTATEINAQVAQASNGFQTKVRALEGEAYKQLGEKFLKMVQIFATEEQVIRITGRQGAEFKLFDPAQYWGPYDVKVVLESSAKAKQKEEGKLAMEMYNMFGADPNMNVKEMKKLVLQKAFNMDDDDIELLLTPDPMQQAMMMNPMAGGAPAPAPGAPVA